MGAGSELRQRGVVAALGVTQILAWGCSYYLPAVLAQPITMASGWPLPWIIGGLSLGLLVAGLCSPMVGRAIERTGGRPVLASSSALLDAGLVVLGLAPNLPAYLAAWLVIGVGMGAGLYDAAFATLGRLYGADARAAITNLTLIAGFSSTVCWPLSALLVQSLGWRGTCLAYAGLQLLLAFPIHLRLVPRLPTARTCDDEAVGLARPQPAPVSRDRSIRFLLLATGLTLGTVIQSMMGVHLLTILQARGLDLAAAVGLGALVGPAQVAARVIEKLLGARLHPIWTMLASALLLAAGLGLLVAGGWAAGHRDRPWALRRRGRHLLDRARDPALGPVRRVGLCGPYGQAGDADAGRRGPRTLGRRPAAGPGRRRRHPGGAHGPGRGQHRADGGSAAPIDGLAACALGGAALAGRLPACSDHALPQCSPFSACSGALPPPTRS